MCHDEGMRTGIAALLPFVYDDDLAAEVIRRGLSITAVDDPLPRRQPTPTDSSEETKR